MAPSLLLGMVASEILPCSLNKGRVCQHQQTSVHYHSTPCKLSAQWLHCAPASKCSANTPTNKHANIKYVFDEQNKKTMGNSPTQEETKEIANRDVFQ